MKFKVIFNYLLLQMYSDRRGNGQNHPGQNLPGKDPLKKALGEKPPRIIEREFVQEAFVRVFYTRPTKNRGGPRCVTYFWGVPGCVTEGRG